MPISGQGWELHLQRHTEQRRNGRRRTIGTYVIYHDGLATPLSGTCVETKGPGANTPVGNGRRVEAGRYPLATQDGRKYKTWNYVVSGDPDVTPKPGIELLRTGEREEILVHPGHGFLASIGCINLTAALPDGRTDIPFVDSRERVIAAINDLKTYCGAQFPATNGRPIPKAWVVIDGEP